MTRLVRLARLAQPLLLSLAPVLAVQGLRVRRTTPRLPEASGPRRGTTGGGPGAPLRLAVLGESTAAGVGVATHEEGLAGCLARAVAARTGRPVRWQVAARTGVNTRTATAELVPLLEPADAVVVALGVNELLELNRLDRFGRELRALVAAVRARMPEDPGAARVDTAVPVAEDLGALRGAAGREDSGAAPGVPILVTGMPPVGRFPVLPQPLRAVMGLRARALDHVMAAVAASTLGVTHVRVEVPVEVAGFFAEDGFHPSAAGYETWAEGLAGTLTGVLTGR
ncbi:SGNH hydrolase [Planobispora rosea]|uniref:SGNH hydrolase n=1 Tax=Planobispora rosea TaxID=35762 RepID=A0A8J3RZJ4_PLARO|nr:SGNH/GDSL hydrolase family protein [Planobispora rosea]GGS58765.1 SGNH hydrolase [Planobispora rosea]GIH84712.1 SGNH hydrolase [Planobispora rosea]